jgi:hypothetical protein
MRALLRTVREVVRRAVHDADPDSQGPGLPEAVEAFAAEISAAPPGFDAPAPHADGIPRTILLSAEDS